jgi:hypothetical protein
MWLGNPNPGCLFLGSKNLQIRPNGITYLQTTPNRVLGQLELGDPLIKRPSKDN